jgi:hypothetical protein
MRLNSRHSGGSLRDPEICRCASTSPDVCFQPIVAVEETCLSVEMSILTALVLTSVAVIQADHQDVDNESHHRDELSLTATFDRSEWTPPGRLALDLRTGRYELTPAPSRRRVIASGAVQVRRGNLDRPQLASLRAAIDVAGAEGMRAPTCQMIVSNAGPIMISVQRGAGAMTTPDQLGCWSNAARGLHRLLEAVFGYQVYPDYR